jgi:excisionase family DNA binding protein
MRASLEHEDLTAMAKEVSKLLAPLLKKTEQGSGNDTIFNLKELSEYLNVPDTWVYRQTCDHNIPYYKLGGYLRFKKPEIDKWLEEKRIIPIPKH